MKYRSLLCCLLYLLVSASASADRPVDSAQSLVAIEGSSLTISNAVLLAGQRLSHDKPTIELVSSPRCGELTRDGKGGFVFRPNHGSFGSDSFTYSMTTSTESSILATISLWTAPSRIAFSGNWDGDPNGFGEFAWLDNGTNALFLCNGSPKEMVCDTYSAEFKIAGLDPLAMDWDGDGFDEIALFDSESGTFRITEPVKSHGRSTLRVIDRFSISEAIGQRPLAGDWDGDAVDTIGLYDSGTGRVRLRNENLLGPFDHDFFLDVSAQDIPIVGDWDRDNIDTVGTYNHLTGLFSVFNTNSAAPPSAVFFGTADALPLSDNWNLGPTSLGLGVYHRNLHSVEALFRSEVTPSRAITSTRMILLPVGTGAN